jgi:hypothetical protein
MMINPLNAAFWPFIGSFTTKDLSPLNGGRSRKMSKVIKVVFALLFASSIVACGGDKFDLVETAGSAGVLGSDDSVSAAGTSESEGGSDAVAGSSSDEGVGGRKTTGVGGRKVSDESEGGSDATAGSSSEGVGGRKVTGAGGKTSVDESEGGSDATAGSKSDDGVGGRKVTGAGGKTSVDESEGGSDATAGSTSVVVDEDGDGDPAAKDCDDNNPAFSHLRPEICDDGYDNNCDGKADCEDPECVSSSYCSTEVDADNDGELAVDDCNDGDPRISHFLNEDCDDGKDNDCDGMADCEDPDCTGFSFCNGGSIPTTGTRIEVHNFLPKQVGASFESLSDFGFDVVFPEEHTDASCKVASIMDPLIGEYVQGVRCTIERKVDEEFIFTGSVGDLYLTGWDCVPGTECVDTFAVYSVRDYVTVNGYAYAALDDGDSDYPCSVEKRYSGEVTVYAVLPAGDDCAVSTTVTSSTVSSNSTIRIETHNFIPNGEGESFSASEVSDAEIWSYEPAVETWPCTAASIVDPRTGNYVQGAQCKVARDTTKPFVYGGRVGGTYLSAWDCAPGTGCTPVALRNFRDYVTASGYAFAALDDGGSGYPRQVSQSYRSDVEQVYCTIPVP